MWLLEHAYLLCNKRAFKRPTVLALCCLSKNNNTHFLKITHNQKSKEQIPVVVAETNQWPPSTGQRPNYSKRIDRHWTCLLWPGALSGKYPKCSKLGFVKIVVAFWTHLLWWITPKHHKSKSKNCCNTFKGQIIRVQWVQIPLKLCL